MSAIEKNIITLTGVDVRKLFTSVTHSFCKLDHFRVVEYFLQ
jgi:hypothetical protein